MAEQTSSLDPQNVPVRPLSKGMVLHLPPQMLEPGCVLDARNLIATPGGLKRRSGYLHYNSNFSVRYPPIRDVVTFWKTDGTQAVLILDTKFPYEIVSTGYTLLSWQFTSATNITVTGSGVHAAADVHWNDSVNEVRVGDVLIYDTGGTIKYGVISSITDGDDLVLETSPGNYGPAGAWYIARAFGAATPFQVDHTVVPGAANIAVFSDATRGLYSYNGTTMTHLATVDEVPTATTWIPSCVVYFRDRIYCGYMVEVSGTFRQRIRWSNAGVPTVFESASYLDLPYVQGALRRLVPMGAFLVALFDDAIFIGRPTNISDLPYAFTQVETGGIGLLGMKAVCRWMDGLFFIGGDNIYYLSNRGLESIGDPIVKETIRKLNGSYYAYAYATVDVKNDCILFGFPESSSEIVKIFRYNYRSKGWTYDSISSSFLASTTFLSSYTWENWVATSPYELGTVTSNGTTTIEGAGGCLWNTASNVLAGDVLLIDTDGSGNYPTERVVASITDNDTLVVTVAVATNATPRAYRTIRPSSSWEGTDLDKFPNWESIEGSAAQAKDVYLGSSGYLFRYQEGEGMDLQTSTIPVRIVLPDFDYNQPDEDKVWTRLSLKLEEVTDIEMQFLVESSINRGNTWKNLGQLIIEAGEDEGKVDFRSRGSICRFRLTEQSAARIYTVNEIVLRVRGGGNEIVRQS